MGRLRPLNLLGFFFFPFFPAAVRVRWGPSGPLIRLSPLYLVIGAQLCLQELSLSLCLPVCIHVFLSLIRIQLTHLASRSIGLISSHYSNLLFSFIHSFYQHFIKQAFFWSTYYVEGLVLGGEEEKGRE